MAKWNEFETFSQKIIPYLTSKELHYPPRTDSNHFDEQRWVQKKGAKRGPYDGAYKECEEIILLIEAKRESKKIDSAAIEQAKGYALGGSFPVPPPFLLVSNGDIHKWFHRKVNKDGSFSYNQGSSISWREAIQAKGRGDLTVELSLDKAISLLKEIRYLVYDDLKNTYFPNGFSLNKSKLNRRRTDFEKILFMRKTFVDVTLSKVKEETAIQAILSSIALSWTLKILFIKIIRDLRSDSTPKNIRSEIDRDSIKFPGILKAAPYDSLPFSDSCEASLVESLLPVRLSQAIVFDLGDKKNPIGAIWDALVISEEKDLQVKSLGNVYTPNSIVEKMVLAARNKLGSFKNKKILEPSCGSGHFIRECYHHMIKDEIGKEGGRNPRQKLIKAHKTVLANIKATDIDPFAIQTTQLGLFLELYRRPGVWSALTPKGKFNFDKIITQQDSLALKSIKEFKSYKPDLVIGNPPYGVSVTDSNIQEKYNLGSNDSYGYFIALGVDILPSRGQLFFIVSNTFLTTRRHIQLREKIVQNSSIESVFTVHRSAFPGRDVFCCILNLSYKSSDNIYKYYDAWPIHPQDSDFSKALAIWSKATKPKGISSTKLGYYKIPQNLLDLRNMPPHPSAIKKYREEYQDTEYNYYDESENLLHANIVSRNLLDEFPSITVFPIFSGLPSLFLLCSDKALPPRITESYSDFPLVGKVKCLKLKAATKDLLILKLWQLASVMQGLATADDPFFIRKTAGVIPNARRKYVKDVNKRATINTKQLRKLSEQEKKCGVPVIDPQRDRSFIPFDTGGESNIEEGVFRSFISPIDYWIDWSTKAVSLLKRRDKFPSGTTKKPRLNNFDSYFSQGIVATITGLYAPMYCKGFGGVFGQKANLIIPFVSEITDFLLIILSSKLLRYIAKNYICNTVDFSTENFRHLPIVIPTNSEMLKASAILNKIIILKKMKNDKHKNEIKINKMVDTFTYKIFGISKEDQHEIEAWFKRRYPNFGRRPTSASSPKAPD